MSFPNDINTRRVYGRYLTAKGVPARGRVTFTPTATVVDENDAVIIQGITSVALNANGEFSIILPTTDNANLSPLDLAY